MICTGCGGLDTCANIFRFSDTRVVFVIHEQNLKDILPPYFWELLNYKHVDSQQCPCLSFLYGRSYGELSETNMSATRDAVGRFLGSDEMSPPVLEMNWIDPTEMWLNINTSPLPPPFETSRGLLVTKISAIPSYSFFVPSWCS